MFGLTIRASSDLTKVAAALKEAGDTGLRKELLSGIRKATKPVVADVRKSARSKLPKHGGLNEVVAKSRISSRTRLGGRQVGVRIVAQSGHDIAAMNRGQLRHPVFGNKARWVTQPIEPGFWREPIEENAPVVKKEVQAAIDAVAKKLRG